MPARCARRLAAGHPQPCSEVRVVCGTCASHPAVPAEQGVPTGPTPSTLDLAVTPEAESRTDPQALAEAADQATAVEDRRAERLKPRAEEIDVNTKIKVMWVATKAAEKAVQAATAKQRNEVRTTPPRETGSACLQPHREPRTGRPHRDDGSTPCRGCLVRAYSPCPLCSSSPRPMDISEDWTCASSRKAYEEFRFRTARGTTVSKGRR
jgi:hypothetical protein